MKEPIKEFTTSVPFWRPRVIPLELKEASNEQLNAMKVTVSNTEIGEYTLVLALDPETLQQRTPLFNGIMYGRGGLSRAETELGAVAASVVNRCIYCAAVHADRYNQLTKDQSVINNVFSEGENTELDERPESILKFAAKLSNCPSDATEADAKRLVDNGLNMGEILDLILSASLFGWANRLMHVLGDPLPQD